MYTLKFRNGISLSALSIQGRREQQQDYYTSAQLRDRTIAIVCDGMGGLEGGNIASKVAADRLLEDLMEVGETDDMYSFFQRELEKLDDMIYGLRNTDGTRMGAGTTLVSVLMFHNKLYWFSVGDSKMYYKRGKEFCCVTREHNYSMRLRELKASNRIGEEQYRREQIKGERLISFLGLGMAEIFDSNYTPFEMKTGDRILLCTDGVYRTLGDEKISEIMSGFGTSEKICQMFEDAIILQNHSNQDNATWIVIQKIGE